MAEKMAVSKAASTAVSWVAPWVAATAVQRVAPWAAYSADQMAASWAGQWDLWDGRLVVQSVAQMVVSLASSLAGQLVCRIEKEHALAFQTVGLSESSALRKAARKAGPLDL